MSQLLINQYLNELATLRRCASRKPCATCRASGSRLPRRRHCVSKLRMTPAMQAGFATTFMSFEDVIARIDAARLPKVRGPYKKRVAA